MDQLQVLCLPTVRKISGESDPVEAPGKDVLQEHPDKISTSDGKCFLAAPVGTILITESYMCISYCHDTAVGDRGAERIPGKISYGIPPAVKSLTDERDPFLREQPVDECLPFGRNFEVFRMGEIQTAAVIKLFQAAQVFCAEHGGQYSPGQEKAFMPCFHELTGRRDSPAGEANVNMRVKNELLPPGVQYGKDPRRCPHELRIGTEREQRVLYTFELMAKQYLQVRFDQCIEVVRYGKDNVEVGDTAYQFGIPLKLPLLFEWSLTAGTGTVVA